MAIEADVMEQSYFSKNYTLETEYEMFAPVMVEPGEVTILRINQEFISKEESVIKSENKPPQSLNQSFKAAEPKFIG